MTIYLPIAEMSIDIFVLLFLGSITGILSGMFGVGGGFLMTPLLIFIGIPPSVAVASVSNQITAASLSGCYSHWRKNHVDIRMGCILLVGGMMGSGLGILLFSWLQKQGQIDFIISISYVGFLSLIALMMGGESLKAIARTRYKNNIHRSLAHIEGVIALKDASPRLHHLRVMPSEVPVYRSPSRRSSSVPFAFLPWKVHFPRSRRTMSILLPLIVSMMIGVLVSLLGIGGGFFLIPAMLYILKMPASVVVGTSLFQAIFVTAHVTFLHAMTTQSVDIVLAGLMLIGSSFGAQLGIRYGLKTREEHVRLLLAVMVMFVALRLGYDLISTPESLYSISFRGGH
ncbi:MAG: sulfite exporter TauE/SafE family protein [Alphaproteobacteria bacterium]|nr:MAG: sulfite exporter TauE/SafE family protein [Alphaproteobacteria bacterium]TAF40373.1 MAG: sulfite exporter TauE/SafE family protein [Alphaproteobacteria bacterium]TAF77510.1 MAG: sulfite exporter TauE/SafE family protein [Alphaproteobacteria bacterium]